LSSTPKVYTTSFWLLCVSALLFFASFNMIIPELPDYLTALGGAEYKGLIISLFTITAMVSRPFSGKLSDTIGRVPVMIVGAAVCFICSLFYPIIATLFGFFALRFVHGFSTGFTPTGGAAYLADIVPVHKRGEAMGLLGTAGSIGMALGPAVGGTIANQAGLDAMFYCSSFFGLIAILIVLRMKETLPERVPFSTELLKVKREDFFEPLVLVPCLIMVLTAYAYGSVLTIIPDFGQSVGIKNKGVLFSCLTVASLMVRLLAGKASDKFGRVEVLRVTTLMIFVAMLVIGLSSTPLMLIVGVALYGLGQGSTSPTLMAWATDLSDSRFKGRGIASLYISMELGIGLGALCSGWVYANKPGNFFITFLISGLLGALAFAYLVYPSSRRTR